MLKILVSGSYPLVDYIKQEIQKRRDTIKELTIQELEAQHILKHPQYINSEDILICGVVMAERLKSLNVRGHIIPLRLQTKDFLNALIEASNYSKKICIVNYYKEFIESNTFNDQHLNNVLGLNIQQRAFTTKEHAAEVVQSLSSDKELVVIGSGLIVNMAKEAGMQGVLWYGEETITLAVDIAFSILSARGVEKSNLKRLQLIAESFQEGVISLNVTSRVISMNQAAIKFLQLDDLHDPTSLLISDILPQSEFLEALQAQQVLSDVVMKYKDKNFLVNTHLIYVDGLLDGMIAIFSDVELLQQKENKVRRKLNKRYEGAKYNFSDIIGESPQMMKVISKAKRFARTNSNVLILGETGTGKELFAQSIHNTSQRANHPFIAVNCAAIPENLLESEFFGYNEGAFTGASKGGKAGLFEEAHNGTIFLDEIGELPLSMQAKLLRVLQEKVVRRIGSAAGTPINVRVISATNVNLIESIRAGEFREDLYYRIAVLNLFLPKLSNRKEDLGLLLKHFTKYHYPQCYSMIENYYADVLPLIEHHQWKGNVREFENTIERLYAYVEDPATTTKEMLIEYLQEAIEENFYLLDRDERDPYSFQQVLKEVEITKIQEVLEQTNGNRQEAAKILGISRSTLWRKLNESGVK
ncbi:sigma 54-interacting transcriptional regulator [Psychrobacillus sp. NPDC096426]|uniref:sigma 54-interacting transcriptional regulator n=1 Tax=Psychrobacillus sp. NPDC096426 TaxID=3364491 RepID=UPI003811EC86